MAPIITLCRAAKNGEIEKVEKILPTIKVTLKSDEKTL